MVDVPRVDSCCFGILDLKWGSLVCAIVTLVLTSTVFGYDSYAYGHSNDILNTIQYLLVLLGVIGAILLIIGILIDKPELAKLYIIAYALLFVIAVIVLILMLIKYGSANRTNYIIQNIVLLCIIGYCIVVVNSFHKTI